MQTGGFFFSSEFSSPATILVSIELYAARICTLTFHGLLYSKPAGASAFVDWPLQLPVSRKSLSITIIWCQLGGSNNSKGTSARGNQRTLLKRLLAQHYSTLDSTLGWTYLIPSISVPPGFLVLISIVFCDSQADAGHDVHLGHSVSWSHHGCSGAGRAYANDDSIRKECLKWHTHVGNRNMDALLNGTQASLAGELASLLQGSWSDVLNEAEEGARAVSVNSIAAWQTRMSWRDQSAAHPALLTAREAIRGLSALEKRAKSFFHWLSFESTRSETCYCCRSAWISVGILRFDRGALELLSWTCATNRTPQGFVNRLRFTVDALWIPISLRIRDGSRLHAS